MTKWVAAASVLLACPAVAFGQAPTHEGQPEDRISRLLAVASTDPVIVKCQDGWSDSCFRIVLRIRPGGGGAVDVGHIPVHRERAATAFTATGASCKENWSRGLPNVVVWSSGDFTWREPAFRVTSTRAATLLLEFGCDGRVAPGDEVNIQFALAVDPDERDILTARYALSGLSLVKMPGMSSR